MNDDMLPNMATYTEKPAKPRGPRTCSTCGERKQAQRFATADDVCKMCRKIGHLARERTAKQLAEDRRKSHALRLGKRHAEQLEHATEILKQWLDAGARHTAIRDHVQLANHARVLPAVREGEPIYIPAETCRRIIAKRGTTPQIAKPKERPRTGLRAATPRKPPTRPIVEAAESPAANERAASRVLTLRERLKAARDRERTVGGMHHD